MDSVKHCWFGRKGVPVAGLVMLIAIASCSVPVETNPIDSGPVERPGADATPGDASTDADASARADAAADADASNIDDISDVLKQATEDEPTPSIAAVVFGPEGVEAAGVAGVRKFGAARPATIDDRYHLGSNTKAMTATLAARLVEQDVLSWDATAADLLDLADVHAEYESVTLIDFLSHTSGVTGNLPQSHSELWTLMWNSEASLPIIRAHVAEELLRQEPSQSPGTFAYSNAGYIIAGAMLEAATGESWEQLMQEHLFDPLKMSSCGFGAAGSSGDVIDEPWPHRYADGSPQPVPPGPAADNPAALGPAGTVHCSLPDYAAFLRVHLGETGFITPQNLQLLQKPVSPNGNALGWFVGERDWAGGVALTHSGSNTMNYAVAWLAPEKDRGIVMCTNISYDDVATTLDGLIGQLIGAYF